MSASLEYRRDFAGERLYASRNYGSIRHTYEAPGACRSTVDWNLTLRQAWKPRKLEAGSASMPNLRTAELRDGQRQDPLAGEHPNGAYLSETETVGRYQNVGNTRHLLRGSPHCVDWQLNLRDGLHRSEAASTWRRHCTRPHQSFDMMKENCGPDNEEYKSSQITPQDRRPDRRSGAIAIATIRDEPFSPDRQPGAEGTQVGQWRHLMDDRSRGHKTRAQLQQEITLRCDQNDSNGARIAHDRSDGCLVEMLGKKRWSDAHSHDPLARKFPDGDAKLYHLSNLRLLPEADEQNRQLRMSRHQPRARKTHEPHDVGPRAKKREGDAKEVG